MLLEECEVAVAVLVAKVDACLAGKGITMVCVTHEMDFARSVADRIVFMDQGQIVEEAAPAAFFSQPESARAQQFLARLQRPG